uniref:Protein TIC 214 n=1 Tax=Draba verna TaxID=161951 RepID=A0A6M8YWA2_9BRAS|nr:Ycf1.2 [Draba verna]QKK42093.1 Ycf1.2 [Draba verna]
MDKKDEEQLKRKETRQMEIAETWDSFLFSQTIRGSILVIQSILRKYLILPLLIIIKNSTRALLFQVPEWSEDLKDWKREMHVKCTYNGVQLSETEFPRNWLTDGIQIKILFPFYLKPWHKSKVQSSQKARTKNKGEKNDFGFLTVWGMETEEPFGSTKKKPSFFEPIFKELKKRIKKFKMKPFRVLSILKERAQIFLKVEKIKKKPFFLKGKIKSISQRNGILLFDLKEISELNETKKDSIMSNQMIYGLSVQKKSMEWTNSLLSENKIKNLIDRIKTIKNQTEEISKEKENLSNTNRCNKLRYDSKIIESSKKSWQTLKRKNIRLIRKSFFFFKFCIEQLFITIFLGIINIPRITTQLFFESTKEILDKSIYIYKNEENEKKNKNEKNTIYFISTIKNLISKKKNFCYDLCSLSQAYVVYKISKIQVNNFSKLKAVLESNICITSFFIKNQIKDLVQEQGIFDYGLKDKTFFNSEINPWKHWLRSNYQYNLPQGEWARLITQRWKKKINKDSLVLNQRLIKPDLYEKAKFDNYKKQTFFEANSLLNPKLNLKKDYQYNLFCYKSINCREKKFDTSFDMSTGTALDNCLVSSLLEKYNIPVIGEIGHRKYLDWRIINFLLKKKVNIDPWVDIKSKKKDIRTKVHNYQKIEKITKTDLANKKSFFFDWMGMNEEILNGPITNFEFFFFPEFFLFSSTYKMKPWIIPIKLLLFNFNKKITLKNNGFIPSNEKGSLQFYNLNNNEMAGQRELESDNEKQRNPGTALKKKNIDKNYTESEIKKRKNKKQYKSHTEAELELFLTRYSRFQLRWNCFLNEKIINNIKVYCLLVRLTNPNEVMISCIERGELSLDILMIEKNFNFIKLMKKGILIIEPVRLSVKNDGQLIIYRTIGISLVSKNKPKISKRYKKKSYINKKNNYDFFIPENILSPKRRREFRILLCFNLKKEKARDRNSRFDKNIKNWTAVLHKNKDLDKDKKALIKLKSFLWPNFILEDLACINRYWFNTTNGNRFSMIRIHMYTRFQIN